MPSESSSLLDYIDSIIKIENTPELKYLTSSLETYLIVDSIENKLEALNRIYKKLKRSHSEEQNPVLVALFSIILSNAFPNKKTISETDIDAVNKLFRRCLQHGFITFFITLFENETVNDSVFSDQLLNDIFETTGASLGNRKINPMIKHRKQCYDANIYVQDLLTHQLYLSDPTVTEKEYILNYLKNHFKTEKALRDFQSSLLKQIHENRAENQYYSNERKPYKTALGFILRVTFPLLQCNNSSIINSFLEKPYRKLPSHQSELPLPVKQPNRFWSFCQRHPYLVSFGIALGVLGLAIGGLATFGVLHFLLATPIIAAAFFVLSQATLTGAISLFLKPISRHFSKTPIVIPQDNRANEPNLSFNLSASTTAMLQPLLSETVEFKECEASDSSDDHLDQETELSLNSVASSLPRRKYWVDVTKPAVIESSDDRTNIARLIARFTIKPRTRKTTSVPVTESTPLLLNKSF